MLIINIQDHGPRTGKTTTAERIKREEEERGRNVLHLNEFFSPLVGKYIKSNGWDPDNVVVIIDPDHDFERQFNHNNIQVVNVEPDPFEKEDNNE